MCAATVLLLQGAWQELSTEYRGILLPGVQLPGGALQAVGAVISVTAKLFLLFSSDWFYTLGALIDCSCAAVPAQNLCVHCIILCCAPLRHPTRRSLLKPVGLRVKLTASSTLQPLELQRGRGQVQALLLLMQRERVQGPGWVWGQRQGSRQGQGCNGQGRQGRRAAPGVTAPTGRSVGSSTGRAC